MKFLKTIERFGKKGEKTGWRYILVEAKLAQKLNPESRVSFRVKGQLDKYSFHGLALIPMGQGDFILPLNAAIRRAIRKEAGDQLAVEMELDTKPLKLSPDLMKCLKQEPPALDFFKSLPRSHQFYFSKWIDSAKTAPTRAKRIAMAVIGLAQHQTYSEMLHSNKNIR